MEDKKKVTKKKNNSVSKKKESKPVYTVIQSKEPEIVTIKSDKKKSFNTNILIVFFYSLIALLSIFFIFFYPSIKEEIEIYKLKKEINTIITENKCTNSNVTTGEREEVEIKIKDYLYSLTLSNNKINSIINNKELNNFLNVSYIDSDINLLDSNINELNNLKEKVNLIKDNNSKYINNNKKLNKLYKSLSKIVDKSIIVNDIDPFIKYLSDIKEPSIYLRNNKDKYKLEDNKIIFIKRKAKEEYDLLLSKLSYEDKNITIPELIVDKDGPIINANNISISKGTKLDLKSKISCIDAVDDSVPCNIEGSFDSNKVGSYNIKITSTDKSNNTSSKNITVTVKEVVVNAPSYNNRPYYIEVIRNQNIVIVYGLDENKEYSKVVKVFVCSAGKGNNTPVGTFHTSKGYTWGSLFGGVYGQYSTRITGSILFHSVPYYTKNKGDLEWEEYNKLGTKASAGCIRMAVRDVKWIFDNVAAGTTVKIYDGNIPPGITKPSAIKIPADSPNKGWDPTDPDPNNPWRK